MNVQFQIWIDRLTNQLSHNTIATCKLAHIIMAQKERERERVVNRLLLLTLSLTANVI